MTFLIHEAKDQGLYLQNWTWNKGLWLWVTLFHTQSVVA